MIDLINGKLAYFAWPYRYGVATLASAPYLHTSWPSPVQFWVATERAKIVLDIHIIYFNQREPSENGPMRETRAHIVKTNRMHRKTGIQLRLGFAGQRQSMKKNLGVDFVERGDWNKWLK